MAIASRVASRSVWTPANVVTMSRIALSPFVVAAIYWAAPSWWVPVFGFCSMMTDRLDGWLARKYGVTDFGTFLDPLADKFMVLGSLAALVVKGWVWWVPVAIIAAREVAMSYWRSHLARRGESLPARPLAKIKTWSQSVAVAVALAPGVVANARWVVTLMIWISVALTVITFVQYVRDSPRAAKTA